MAEVRFQRKLRKAGASLILSIPVEIERNMNLKEGQDVDVYISSEREIKIEPKKNKR